jgi:hypothetical protein
MADEHDHRRAFCMCGTRIFDGWLNPDGIAHACAFWPPPGAAAAAIAAGGRAVIAERN